MSQNLPTLDAGDVRLRQLSIDDLVDLHAVFADPQSMRYWSRPAFTELDETRGYLAAIDDGRVRGDLLQWGIEHLDSQKIIGTTTLFSIDRQQGRAEIGYILGSAHWGKGYASSALGRLLRHTRDDLGLRRIEADVDPRNAASCGSSSVWASHARA